ncbi:trissin receptor-like [Lineus longissimus]|uniref:trissin receptor-like n=1 Tax=Lineus longissimus TaxID=88925 RepID=UPI002B4F724D
MGDVRNIILNTSGEETLSPHTRSCVVFNATLNTSVVISNCSEYGMDVDFPGGGWMNPFDVPHIRALFITAYAIVFTICVVGNAAVIYVILRSRRMRSITNFFLANLAFADFCVGIFCVLPTLKKYLDTIWVLGRVMCKLNYFIQQMAYVASVTILTVIAIERYVAIIYPMKSKQLTTKRRLICIIVHIWIIAISYNVIQLVVFDTSGMIEMDGMRFEFCVPTFEFDRKTYNIFNFFLWYLIPLIIMSVLYTKISIVLWRSTMLSSAVRNSTANNNQKGSIVSRHSKLEETSKDEESVLMTSYKNSDDLSSAPQVETNVVIMNGSPTSNSHKLSHTSRDHGAQRSATGTDHQLVRTGNSHNSDDIEDDIGSSSTELTCLGSRVSSRRQRAQNRRRKIQYIAQKAKSGGAENLLRSRRRVVRLLVLVVASFAACSLPFQAYVLITAWDGYVPSLVPPTSILIMFFNSGLNPILYAFFSENFRRATKEVFVGGCGRLRRKEGSVRTSVPAYTTTGL